MKQFKVLFRNSKPLVARRMEQPDTRIVNVSHEDGQYAIRSMTVLATNEREGLFIAGKLFEDRFAFLFNPPVNQNILNDHAYSLN